MPSIDINCDLGEGKPNDASIMPFVSSANIACGYHAGDESSIRTAIRLAIKNRVAIGAHPGFADKENFGRVALLLPAHDYYKLAMEQLVLFKELADQEGVQIHHVKPHGALYNLAVKNEMVATELAKAVHDFDPSLIYYGLSNSSMLQIAEGMGLKTASEVFADRSYQEDGTLTPRTERNAIFTDPEVAAKQALMMAREKKVMSISGKPVAVDADTICIHGDLPQAYSFAKAVYNSLKENKIEIKSI
jgi:5-oxoprolinase (ATP-hydrolysing) subunit A